VDVLMRLAEEADEATPENLKKAKQQS